MYDLKQTLVSILCHPAPNDGKGFFLMRLNQFFDFSNGSFVDLALDTLQVDGFFFEDV